MTRDQLLAYEREWRRKSRAEIAQRRAELLGERQRKLYRNSKAAQEQAQRRRISESMREAVRRLWRVFA